ncbi:MAG: hypothetical protein ACK5WT_13380, partial [Betaproteobacteria bacterium]
MDQVVVGKEEHGKRRGAAGQGARRARALLARGALDGRRIERIVLADQAAPPAWLAAEARVEARVGPLLQA